MKSVMTNMMAGLNAYEKSDMIGDNQLSDSWDATIDEPTKAVKMYSIAANSLLSAAATGAGYLVNAIAAVDSSGNERIVFITKDNIDGADSYFDDLYDYYSSTKTTVDISSHQLSGTYTSMCLFNTEAKRYVCFSASSTKKLLYYDFTSVGTITLPFYPKQIFSHCNRVFAFDTINKLWWCRAGDIFTWYGLEEDDDKIVTSTAMLDSTAYSIAAHPDVPRPLSITVTATSTIDTLGTLAFVGTDSLGAAQSKTYTPIQGKYVTPDTWASVTSITAAGHTAVAGADKIKIGIAAVTGYVQDDAGYWTIEQETTLVNMTVLGGNLFIWSPNNIYVFQGYSYDTFSLSKVISDLGCVEDTDMTACGNIAYFWGTNTELYEYNGNDYPNIINKPVYVNGSVVNNVSGSMGGEFVITPGLPTIDEDATTRSNLTATTKNLYLYGNLHSFELISGSTYNEQADVYVFDIRRRSWWKIAGFTYSFVTSSAIGIMAKYIQSADKSDTYNFYWTQDDDDEESVWNIYDYIGNTYSGGSSVITKAFNNGISDNMTLTNIIIYARYVKPGGPV